MVHSYSVNVQCKFPKCTLENRQSIRGASWSVQKLLNTIYYNYFFVVLNFNFKTLALLSIDMLIIIIITYS